MKYELHNADCIEWMSNQKEKSIDCIITSPPYNLDIKYGRYQDDLPRQSYLKWLHDVAVAMNVVLKDTGHLFLNVGYSNVDPWVAMDVAQVFREVFVLQNNLTWVKHIAVNDQGYGQYKPIASKRFASATTESIFHFTKTGEVEVDRLAIGQRNKSENYKYPELYSEERYVSTLRRKVSRRLGFKNWTDLKQHGTPDDLRKFETIYKKMQKENPYDPEKKKCIGNAWFIPYVPTSRLAKEMGVKNDPGSREKGRGGHPATFPEGLPTQCIKFSGIAQGSIVYDPFVGTGTTVISAIKNGMVGIGCDIDVNYLNFASERIEYHIAKVSKENTPGILPEVELCEEFFEIT